MRYKSRAHVPIYRAHLRGLVAASISALLAGCQATIPPYDVDVAAGKALLSKARESNSAFYTIEFRNGLRIVISNLEMQDNQHCYVLLSQRTGTSFSDEWLNYASDGSGSNHRCDDYAGVVKVEPRDARR